MTTRRRSLAPALAVTLAAASPARAHLMNTAFGPFFDGATHLFLTPQDLLPVVALALLAGLRGPRCGRAVLFMLPAAWLASSIAGLPVAPQATPAAAIMTVALGALVAADRPVPPAAILGFAIVLGLLGGSASGNELAQAGSSVLGVAGVATALFVVLSLLAGQVTAVRAAAARVAVRVAGSWIAAIGMLMVGWSVRRG